MTISLCCCGVDSLTQMLKSYYSSCLPIDSLFQWIGSRDVSKLEWAFELSGSIYVRYLCFKDAAELKAKLVSKEPVAIHIGAVYNYPPSQLVQLSEEHKIPKSSHLVFDLDASDYDDVRHCCKKKQMCARCWPLIAAAMKLCDVVLRKAFGFSQLLWVFSGRRGVHCWVSDPRAMALKWEGRCGIAEYITTSVNAWSFNTVWIREDWYNLLEPMFQIYINKQRLFMGCDGYTDLLQGFVDKQDQYKMPVASDCKIDDNESAWPHFRNIHADRSSKGSIQWRSVRLRIVFKYVQPRLDAKVTQQTSHLLKIPFSVHMATQKICCPIDMAKLDEFDPDTVPTVEQVTEATQKGEDGKLTNSIMEGYIATFNKSLPPSDLSW
jgi:DNA primase small subunit